MKNYKFFIKATMAIVVVIAFAMPASAYNAKNYCVQQTKPDITNFLADGWIEQASGFWEPSRGINYMHAVDENIVWAIGYDGSGAALPVQEFTKTINGGDLWEADGIFTAPDDGEAAMICAVDADHAWIPFHSGSPQGIWATSDGGNTWVHQTTAAYSGAGAFPNCVHFWDENNGWCQGDPVDGYYEMYTTTDGGTTWVRVPETNIPAPLSGEYGTVGYYDVVGDTIWFGTQNAYPLRVFKSIDRGLTWEVYDTPFASGSYVDIRFKDQNNGIAMDKNFEDAVIAETSDGGETWTFISYSGKCYGADFDYVPGTTNTYVSTGVNSGSPDWMGASYSNDGGHTWITWDEVSGTQLFGTTWVEGGIGWAGNFNVDEFTGGVYKYIPGSPEPILVIESVEGGRGITAVVKNVGTADATNVEYSITIDGGLIITPKTGSGNLGTIAPGESQTISLAPKGIGLGFITAKPLITISVDCDEGSMDSTSRAARIFIIFVMM
ncbi:MAG: hypothetical protein KKC68_04330 [Candidatus Thermoplasmatota archaeon]|nr:hypothetical protein [Candidatus Thermoplasmatota archaeon]